jgi:hypothetical protein
LTAALQRRKDEQAKRDKKDAQVAASQAELSQPSKSAPRGIDIRHKTLASPIFVTFFFIVDLY